MLNNIIKEIREFVNKHKVDILIFISLFILSLIFNFVFTEKSQLGELSTDSPGYTLISEALADFHWPRWTRTPTYPIFLTICRWFTHSFLFVDYVQMVLNAFNAPLIYLILRMIGLNKTKATIGGLLIIPNYHVIAYTHTIFTEGLIIPIFLTYMVAAIQFAKKHNSWLNTFVFTFLGIALFFTKPGYYVLQIALLVALTIYLLYTKRKIFWKQLLASFVLTITMILGWQSLTHAQFGYFSMGYVTHINELGKYMQYGYLDDYEITENTSPELAEFVKQNEIYDYYSPYSLRNKVRDAGVYIGTREIINVNKEVSEGKKLDFILQSVELYPSTLSKNRYYRFGLPKTEWKQDLIEDIEEKLYDTIKPFYLIGIVSVATHIFYLIGQKKTKDQKFVNICILFISVFYSTLMVSTFGYDDYQRLNITTEPLMIIFVYLFFLWIVDILKDIIIRIANKNEN